MTLIMKPGIRLANAFTWNETVWNPSMIQTALWLDAADASTITQSSNLVSQVNDKSGNSRNFTASGGARPTYTTNSLNGLPVFTYSGSQWLTSTSAASTWNFLHLNGGAETMAVWRAGNTSDPNAAYGLWGTNGGSVNNLGIYQRWDDRSANGFNNALVIAAATAADFVLDVSANNVHAANVATILGASLDLGNATTANRVRHLVNGTVLDGTNTSANATASGDAGFTLQVGTLGNNTFPLVGYVAEFLVFSNKLSQTNRQRVEGYLAHKWGLTANLPAGHPYKTVGPTP